MADSSNNKDITGFTCCSLIIFLTIVIAIAAFINEYSNVFYAIIIILVGLFIGLVDASTSSEDNSDLENDKHKSNVDDKSIKFWLVLLFTPTIVKFVFEIELSLSASIMAIFNAILLVEFFFNWHFFKRTNELKKENELKEFKNRHNEVEKSYQTLFELINSDEKYALYKEQVESLFKDIFCLDKECCKEEKRLIKLEQLEKELTDNSKNQEANSERLENNNEMLLKISEEKKKTDEFISKAMKEINETSMDFTTLRAELELSNDSQINEFVAKIKTKSDSLRFLQNNIPNHYI